MFSLVFNRRFSMAHRLIAGASEKCAVPHGHNEIVTVELQATSPAGLDGGVNMVEPFETAKTTWHRWIDEHVDHALQISDQDRLIDWFLATEPHHLRRLLVTRGDPTTEMVACCMMAKLNAFLADEGGRLVCVSIRLEETPTNVVSFSGNPLTVLPKLPTNPWWNRPDMTINDLHSHGAPDRLPVLLGT